MSDRANKYADRLDRYLPTLPSDDHRIALLRAQHDKWIREYQGFMRAVDRGDVEVSPDHPDAHDYLQTICVIDERLGKFERRAA